MLKILILVMPVDVLEGRTCPTTRMYPILINICMQRYSLPYREPKLNDLNLRKMICVTEINAQVVISLYLAKPNHLDWAGYASTRVAGIVMERT